MATNVLRRPTPTEPACTRVDPELFYSVRPLEIALAKTICAACPVRAACLQSAMDRGEPFGVWGGKDPAERVAHQRRHNGVRANSALARRARVVELSNRMNTLEIAEVLGVTPEVVCADRIRTGIAATRSNWAERRAQVYRMHDEGHPIAVIMLETELSRRTVSRYLVDRRQWQARAAA